ncbi:MAG: DNA topoisomerase IB [Shimia sp.]
METPPGLIYYPDDRPGISRRRAGRGWSYRAPDGTRIDDAEERERLNALAVPPAYTEVWISPKVNGHLQATGLDAETRKQYRYHPDWTAHRAQTKFDGLAEFGAALPALRSRLHRVLTGGADGPEFAIAACLRLIDRAALRVGSPDYAEDRKVYGAVTLRTRHLSLTDDEISLKFRAKGGQVVEQTLRDATLQAALEELSDLPGGDVMVWEGADGPHRIGPDHVNEWLREATGLDATAKTFRTWAGSAAAMGVALRGERPSIKAMADAAAERLHNTPTIARNSYIHPDVIALSEGGRTEAPDRPTGLRRDERALLHLLNC